jgi:hypothetical protein
MVDSLKRVSPAQTTSNRTYPGWYCQHTRSQLINATNRLLFKQRKRENTMYFTIIGRVEETNDASYTREIKKKDGTVTEEIVTQFEIALTIPGMRDRVRVTFNAENAPTQELMEKWELDEPWVVVQADSMRANAFEGNRGATALVSFNGVDIHEASADERKKLQSARKEVKQKNKTRRVQAKAEREAARKAQSSAA